MTSLTRRFGGTCVVVKYAAPSCPLCSGLNVGRTLRRRFDRIISLVVPVRRYRCKSCGWTGNLTVNHHSGY